MFKVIFEINIIIFYCFKISNINNTFIQIYQKESNIARYNIGVIVTT